MTGLPNLAADGRADLSHCRVLVVDDAQGIRKIIGAYLQAAGIHHIEYATDGIDGLAKVESFEPDLVILDIMMPEMDGFEVCRILRSDAKHRHLPILVQTALESPSERTAVFRAGASDLITKPIHGPELVARVRVQLENRMLIRNLEDYRHHMQLELELARHMQEDLLPEDGVVAANGGLAGLRVTSHFQPSAELGGDMWSIRELGSGRVAVSSVDFAGHGVTAALNTFRLHTLMHQLPPPDPNCPSAYMHLLNAQLVDLLPVHQFATMFYGIIDLHQGSMVWSSAGAPSPILCVGDNLQMLDSSGLPLGISLKAKYRDRQIEFPLGASLLLYSDALTETPDDHGNAVELDELLRMVSTARAARDAETPLAALLDGFRAGRATPTDDLTVVWLSRL
ncbi:MAG TPA: fused response regulator/phosphatase [Candidatus Sulfotelmatobacter sp.]|jgi:sigma-B regulation protein RsbU (phosphoserine phosphatase)|nr:fused response regulator/phosphatase [Candidatus Sulfotelmatobacter sp.]